MNSTGNRKPKTENRVIRQDDHKPKEHCGVFGHPDAARITCFGLYALQICRVRPAHHPWRPGPGQR